MTINLSSYRAVKTGLFVRLAVDYYKTSADAVATSQILTWSDYNDYVTINGEVYTPLNKLANISSTTSEIRGSGNSLTISITGVPTEAIPTFTYSRIKGCPVIVYRVFFDPTTGQQLAISGNPVLRFKGIVNNYSIDESWTPGESLTNNTIVMTCASNLQLLNNKVRGRKTNPSDQQALYPTDTCFDRIPALTKANFNFGSPTQ